MNILITGTSWFIWFHVAKNLLEKGEHVIWIDNENDYYDIKLKEDRRKILLEYKNFTFYKVSIENFDDVKSIFQAHTIDKVIHLAAQAWVRYSITNPSVYIQSNLIGFYNIIELSKQANVQNFVYASSSSVYGKNTKQPFSVEDKVDNPISLYAATKKSNELIAHSYSHLFWLRTTGLRFFTVYGPWWRPDMAMMLFTKWILNGDSINVFNHWKMKRDFTFIDDIVSGVVTALDANLQCEVLNLWNDKPIELEYLVSSLEKWLGMSAIKNYMDMQPWDVEATWADIEHTRSVLSWQPTTLIEEWVWKFITWYKAYYNI